LFALFGIGVATKYCGYNCNGGMSQSGWEGDHGFDDVDIDRGYVLNGGAD